MRSLCHKLFGLAVLFILTMALPSFVRAQSGASCDIPNVLQTGGDSNTSCADPSFTTGPGATCPDGYCSTRRLNTPRRLTLAVKFVKPNRNYAIFVLPGKPPGQQPGEGEVEQCSCESGQIIAKRAVDEICCGIQQGGFNCMDAPAILKFSSDSSITPTPVIVTRNGSPCTGSDCCDAFVPPAFVIGDNGPICIQPNNLGGALTLGVNETSLNGGQNCAFDVTYDPNLSAVPSSPNFSVAPNGPCKLAAVQFSTSAGNSVQADLLDRYLVQVNPNGVNGIVTFTVQDLGGVNHSFTVNTTSLLSLGALAAAIANGYSRLGLGLNVSVLSLPTLAHIPSLQSGGGFTMSPLILISNAPQAARSFGVRGLEGQLIVTETSAPIGLL